ncbi:hypothetical protein ACI1UM_10700 [Lactococcus petauri]|uniref:hypothetical protein n=1 Tax=Lactococcus petauri TaxID=1940789 RepID=UPI00385429FA
MTKIIKIDGKECKDLIFKKVDSNGEWIFKVERIFRNGAKSERIAIGTYKSAEAVRLYVLIGKIAEIMTPQGLQAAIKQDLKPLHEGERLETSKFFRVLNETQEITIERLARALQIEYKAPEVELYDADEALEIRDLAFYKSKLEAVTAELEALRESMRPLLKTVLEQDRARRA